MSSVALDRTYLRHFGRLVSPITLYAVIRDFPPKSGVDISVCHCSKVRDERALGVFLHTSEEIPITQVSYMGSDSAYESSVAER